MENAVKIHGRQAVDNGSVKVLCAYIWQDDFDASITKTKTKPRIGKNQNNDYIPTPGLREFSSVHIPPCIWP
jgi:hypothetical protein